MKKQQLLIQKPLQQLKGAELKEAIREKFKSIARFAKIAEQDYKEVNAIIRGNDPQKRMEVYLLARSISDMTLAGELTSDQKLKIRMALMTHDSPYSNKKSMSFKAFCKKYKFDPTWLSRLLSDAEYGAARINSPNLKRLLKILNLEL